MDKSRDVTTFRTRYFNFFREMNLYKVVEKLTGKHEMNYDYYCNNNKSYNYKICGPIARKLNQGLSSKPIFQTTFTAPNRSKMVSLTL